MRESRETAVWKVWKLPFALLGRAARETEAYEKSPEVCGGGEDQVEGFWEEPTHWRTVKVFSVIYIVTF